MKFALMKTSPRIALFCLFAIVSVLPAQEAVTAKNGKTMYMTGSSQAPLEKEITLGAAKVMTNAIFTVKGGKERLLTEGQVLSADGNLLSPDGSLMPIVDHVVVRGGHAILVKDGEATPLGAEITLSNGTRIQPDGTIFNSDGTRGKLQDGQIRTLDGGAIATRDTVLLKDGKVLVQKDGSSLQVLPGRTLMMNDGTKVLGDGAVIKRDGTRIPLVEGQALAIDGISTR